MKRTLTGVWWSINSRDTVLSHMRCDSQNNRPVYLWSSQFFSTSEQHQLHLYLPNYLTWYTVQASKFCEK